MWMPRQIGELKPSVKAARRLLDMASAYFLTRMKELGVEPGSCWREIARTDALFKRQNEGEYSGSS